MTNDAQNAAQGNTDAAQQQAESVTTQAAQTDSQNTDAAAAAVDAATNADTQTAQTEAADNTQATDANPKTESDDSGLGEEPESDADKFAKEYIGKPEAYDFKDVVLPEGMEFNKDLTDELTEFAGELNLSQKGADKFMNMGVKIAENAKTALLENIIKQVDEQSTKFFEALKADPEIGGNKLDATVKAANIAYKTFIQDVDDEAHAIIKNSGLANNRSFVNAFYQMGRQMQDGTIHTGAPSGASQSRESILYPEIAK